MRQVYVYNLYTYTFISNLIMSFYRYTTSYLKIRGTQIRARYLYIDTNLNDLPDPSYIQISYAGSVDIQRQ